MMLECVHIPRGCWDISDHYYNIFIDQISKLICTSHPSWPCFVLCISPQMGSRIWTVGKHLWERQRSKPAKQCLWNIILCGSNVTG